MALNLTLMRPHFQLCGRNASNLLCKTHFFFCHFSLKDAKGHWSHYNRMGPNLILFNNFIVVFVGFCRKFSYLRFSEPKNSKNGPNLVQFGPNLSVFHFWSKCTYKGSNPLRIKRVVDF